MAEFCLDCWNKLTNANDKASKYIMSKDLELCEECGGYKRIVIVERRFYYYRRFKYILLPLYILVRIPILPYLLYKQKKLREKYHGKKKT